MNAKIFILTQLAAYWPVWRWYAARLTDASDEPWGLVALVTASLYVLLHARNERLNSRELVLPALIGCVYLCSYGVAPPLIRAILAVLAITSSVSIVLPDRKFHLGLLGLLLLSLPIIASLQFYMGFPVRVLTAHSSAALLHLLGYQVEAHGTALSWLGEIIAVDAPCAGIRMLWAGMFLNFTLACFFQMSQLSTWLLYSCSAIYIFLGNVLRATLLFFPESGIIQAPGFTHVLVGLICFSIVALCIIWSHRAVRTRSQRRLICV